MSGLNWSNASGLQPKSYTCGHCGNLVSSNLGYSAGGQAATLYICPHCSEPTYWWGDKRMPGVSNGKDVLALPADIGALYREARDAAAAGAHTASVLACRKLLMNIAVSQGAEAGESFIKYVEHLAEHGFVPPNGRGWVDHIRKRGNEATHEIRLMSMTESDELVAFSEMLLKFIFEFPSKVPAVPPGSENVPPSSGASREEVPPQP